MSRTVGMTGTFFSTDRAYQIPYPVERNFHPFPEMLSDYEPEENAVAPAKSPEVEGASRQGQLHLSWTKRKKALVAKI
jgi:hypothetical protein